MLVRLEQAEKAPSPIFVTEGGDGDTREAGATRESAVPNLRYRWWDGDALEFFAIHERLDFYFRSPFGDDGPAVLDVVAVFFVSCHSSGFGWFALFLVIFLAGEQILSFGVQSLA